MLETNCIARVVQHNYDEVWAIVRSFDNCPSHWRHVQSLSPSLELFWQYRRLLKAGQWNKQSFDTIYKPQFIQQIENDPVAQDDLDYLTELDAQGKNIALVCFCGNVELCHRKLIAEMLLKRGCNVKIK